MDLNNGCGLNTVGVNKCQVCDNKCFNKFCSKECYWHGKKGTKQSMSHRNKISLALKGKKKSSQHIQAVIDAMKHKRKIVGEKVRGVNNGQWKGDRATYQQKHEWIWRWWGHPKKCEHCGKVGNKKNTKTWNIDWANISGTYKRDAHDWAGLCRKCHIAFDKGKPKNVRWVKRRAVWSK